MIDGHTHIYGILGNPIRHSFSPIIHNAGFKALGINAVYVAFETAHLEEAIKGIRALGIQGLSVTIPFKERILQLLDGLNPMARRIGAVNTVRCSPEGLIGYNTDWIGALLALEQRIDIRGKRCLLIGAGGAARAIGLGLSTREAEVFITNRSPERSEALADSLMARWVPWAQRDSLDADIVINATPLGMDPPRDPMPLEPLSMREGMVAMDIVILPERTRWLEEAAKRGCLVVEGPSMLIYQALEQMKIWTGEKAPEAAVKGALETYLAKRSIGEGGGSGVD